MERVSPISTPSKASATSKVNAWTSLPLTALGTSSSASPSPYGRGMPPYGSAASQPAPPRWMESFDSIYFYFYFYFLFFCCFVFHWCCSLYSAAFSVLYCIHCIVLYSLYCTVFTVLYCIHCFVLYPLYCSVFTVLHCIHFEI